MNARRSFFSSSLKGVAPPAATKGADPWNANPAAVAAQRWTAAREVPTLQTYERLAGKV